jgi:hypothetical protein
MPVPYSRGNIRPLKIGRFIFILFEPSAQIRPPFPQPEQKYQPLTHRGIFGKNTLFSSVTGIASNPLSKKRYEGLNEPVVILL